MLLTGGFEPVTMSILDWCQYEDKQLKIDQVLENANITYEQFERIPYFFRKACYQGGVEAMLEAGWKRHEIDRENITSFDKCQYLFTGATIPDYGLRSVQKQIERICPSASWVRGAGLHNPSTFKDRLEQEWIKVRSIDQAYDSLAEKVRNFSGRMIAFNKDVKHAMDCAQVLRDNADEDDLAVIEFHRKVPLEERIQNLEAFKQAENKKAILVCTDAASRGLDIPDVRCVFQIGFASSAVDYLHRIGRTARAGKKGRVVNMYTQDSDALVTSVMQAIDEERSVQDAFSRKRSFRKKIKKEVKKNRGAGGTNEW
jgi:superfamily II DNA/RNA helicase